MWGELSSEWGELSSECGASCLGASFLWGELSWGELSLGRVVRNPKDLPFRVQPFRGVNCGLIPIRPSFCFEIKHEVYNYSIAYSQSLCWPF